MRILMTGATGLIGRELGKALAARGDTLVCLVRDVSSARRRLPFPAECHAWDHTCPVPAAALREVDAVVNLAGEPVEVVTTGRHDPCVGLRATPIAEAMLALTLMDHYLRHRAQNADVRSSVPDITDRGRG